MTRNEAIRVARATGEDCRFDSRPKHTSIETIKNILEYCCGAQWTTVYGNLYVWTTSTEWNDDGRELGQRFYICEFPVEGDTVNLTPNFYEGFWGPVVFPEEVELEPADEVSECPDVLKSEIEFLLKEALKNTSYTEKQSEDGQEE